MKKISALLLIIVLAVSVTAGCSGKDEEEYAQIIDTDSMYSYAMSRAGGLFLVPIVDDIEYISFSCDNGALFLLSGSLSQEENEPETGAKYIELFEYDVFQAVYWMPEPASEDEELPMAQAVITIRAELGDGRNVYQMVNVVVDGINFTLVDSKEGE